MSVETMPAIEQSVRVAVPPERAFRVWTEQTAAWWPFAGHSVFGDEAETVVFEPWVGGRVLERSRSGEEAEWGEVLEWAPPRRFVLDWHPGYARGAPTTELEVRFVPDGGGTLVEIEHRAWERLADRSEAARASYEAGWPVVLRRFVDAV
jgi:uncharacterized protein YndB with AHSA1/START domain